MRELGAYGLRVRGLDGAERWMQEQPSGAPMIDVQAILAKPDRSPSRLDAEVADLALLGGGRLRARRGETAVRYALSALPDPAELLHPYLAPAAALRWQWAGREALHAGAVAIGDGAVLLFGVKESGKSTLLAWMAREARLEVMADDLAVIDRGQVLAGPRSIDLRGRLTATADPEPAAVRGGERERVTLPVAPPSMPVIGSVLLEWGPRLAAAPVPAMTRVELLAAQRTYPPLAGDPSELLNIASRPLFTVARPQLLDELEATASALLERFS